MPKVEAFQIPGLTFWFWSDDHDPPHFHAKKQGEWELRVRFLEDGPQMFELKRGNIPSSRILRSIAKSVQENRIRLLAEWQEKVNHGH